MRIRKNRKLSSFMPAEMIQAYDCQLNQSPWDVISFSEEINTDKPSPRHFDRENNSNEDRNLGDFIGGIIGSDTLFIEKPEKVVINVEDISLKNRDNNIDNQSGSKEAEKMMGCITIDGKRSQCGNDHHFGSLQSHNVRSNTLPNDHLVIKNTEKMERTTTSARSRRSGTMKKGSTFTSTSLQSHNVRSNTLPNDHLVIKNYEKIELTTTSVRRRRSRTTKTTFTSTPNPYEFYYYSGFGPFWGKKRGEIEAGNNNGVNCTQFDRGKLKCINGDEVDGNESSCKERKK